MNAQVVLRQITAPAVYFVGLRHTSGLDLDSSVEGEAIAFRACKLETHPVPSRNSVVAKHHGRAVEIVDHHVHVAVVEEVADGKPARDALFQQRRARLGAGVAESAVALVHAQQFWLAITRV